MRGVIFRLVLGLFMSLYFFKAEAQVFPKIIKKNSATPGANQERKNIELRDFDQVGYLKSLSLFTDSLLFQDIVNLSKTKSVISEEPFSINWAPTNKVVKISDQIQIDSVWVTAFEYYSKWDSNNVDIYDFEASQIKDDIQLVLYNLEVGENWNMPLVKTISSSNFGPRWGRIHYGVDIGLRMGEAVYTTYDGIVRVKGFDRNGWGNYYLVRHKNGLETLYGHLSKHIMELGDEVKAGDLLGHGGSTGRSTGPHLHYEVRYQGLAFNPTQVFDFQSMQPATRILTITRSLFSQYSKTQTASSGGNASRSAAYHRVKGGDNLGSIARRYGVSVSQITKLNRISTRSILRIGQNLRIK
jgi:murein DD-endopeptidase MepM/ murein hydrolase activator NlpD